MPRVNVEALQPGDHIDAKYEVQYVLGKGGMGVVVAALHLDLQETVALKFLLPAALEQKDAVERFLREARAVRKLKSEHIVRVIDVGRLSDSGLPYMAMELLAGEDLARGLDRSGPLVPAVACDVVIQACDAMAEAHSLGIIHRDLKPANLFALSAPLQGRTQIKVLDFGIAKVLDGGGNGTRTQVVMGSASYMSPEQMRSAKNVDARTDIWSLGVTLYELLTGHYPFETESLPELVLAITADPPTPPRTHRPDLSPELEAVVLRCLEKQPHARFQSMGELAAALAGFASAAPRPSVSFNATSGLLATGITPEIAATPRGTPSSPITPGVPVIPTVFPAPSVLPPAPLPQAQEGSRASQASHAVEASTVRMSPRNVAIPGSTASAFELGKSAAPAAAVVPVVRRVALVGSISLAGLALLSLLYFVVTSVSSGSTPAASSSGGATSSSADAAASAPPMSTQTGKGASMDGTPTSTGAVASSRQDGAGSIDTAPGNTSGAPRPSTVDTSSGAKPPGPATPARTTPVPRSTSTSKIGNTID